MYDFSLLPLSKSFHPNLAEIELLLVHRARARFNELKHPDFFQVFGDEADVRAALAALDEEVAAEPGLTAPDVADPDTSSLDASSVGLKRKRE